MRWPRARAHGDRGQAAVELALILPVVVMLIALLLQAALVARDVVLVAHAAREAARAAAVEPGTGPARAAALRSGGLERDRLTVTVQPLETTVQVTVAYRGAHRPPAGGTAHRRPDGPRHRHDATRGP